MAATTTSDAAVVPVRRLSAGAVELRKVEDGSVTGWERKPQTSDAQTDAAPADPQEKITRPSATTNMLK
jgi:hypothetical protein